MFQRLEWVVSAADEGKKLIAFLSERLGKNYSARALKRFLENGHCQINNKIERFASIHLKKGNLIALQIPEHTAHLSTPKFEEDRILFEDDYFLVYNKPAGITSDEKGILKELRKYNRNVRLIHRLDKDTTGVLLLAKDSETFQEMVNQFKEFQVQKWYAAIVDGNIKENEGSIDNYLGKKHVYEGQTIWGAVDREHGLHAHTDWKKVSEGNEATLVYCFPRTGRTHQIRVHMAGIGHPILGDFQYSKRFRCKYRPRRYLLHAYKIIFTHPKTKKLIEVVAAIPEDFMGEEQLKQW